MNTEEIKKNLLEKAAQKPVHLFRQFDVFQRVEGGDSIVVPDQDGDSLFSSGPDYELNRTNELRVMVPENRTAEEVIRGLKKVIAWIEEYPSMFEPGGYYNPILVEGEPNPAWFE